MSEKPKDDIAALCGHVQITRVSYRQFPRVNRGGTAPPPREAAAEPVHASVTNSRGLTPASKMPAEASRPELLPSTVDAPPRYQALRSAVNVAADRPAEGVSAPRRLQVSRLAVRSVCGGAGASTIAATLAKLQAADGAEVLLVDGTGNSLLPFYFGARSAAAGLCAYQDKVHGRMETVHIHHRGGAHERANWTTEEFDGLAERFTCVLSDLPSGLDPSRQEVAATGTALLVIEPDLRSVIQAAAWEEHLAHHDTSHRHFFLLNQFDSSLPLHREIRALLEQQLGQRLLPVSIRRSELVAEALAEGQTVATYAPEADVTADFRAVAEWLRKLSAPAPRARAAFAD